MEFLTQVRYIRHFPNNKEASRVQIFLEFPQLATLSSQREFLNSPRTDLVPSFTVNYPSSVQYVSGPTMRASYRLRDKATIEAEAGLEVTNENDSINGHTRTFRDFSFIGYRLDI